MIKGSKHKPESIAKQRESHRKNPSRYWLGKKRPSQTVLRISLGRKGKGTGKRNKNWRENISKGKKGVKFSKQHIKNLSLAHIGVVNPPLTPEQRIEKAKKMKRGQEHHWWKGGVSKPNLIVRKSFKYRLWREAVFKRDNWTCVWCQQKGGWNKKEKKRVFLQADHIKSFAKYIELRFELSNGRTLCIDCHRKTKTWGNGLK